MIAFDQFGRVCRFGDKGMFTGTCNRSACDERPANWWNPHTHAYYCTSCAILLNRSAAETEERTGFAIKKLTEKMSLEKIEHLNNNGFYRLKVFESGEIGGLQQFMFTVGVCIGIDMESYRCRWCYPSLLSAIHAIDVWDGTGDPPEGWLKQKGRLLNGRHVDRSPNEPVHS